MCQISWSILSLVKSLTAAVIALALVGCGFQLRGQDLINSGYSYVVSGEAKDSRLARELSARLFQSGVLAQDAAEITVELIYVRRQQVDGAVTAEAMLLEQAVRIDVRFRIVDAAGAELQPEQTLSRQRYFRLDRSNLLATAAVKEQVAESLEDELVAQLLRSLNLVLQIRRVKDAG